MHKLKLGYGLGNLEFELPEANLLDILLPVSHAEIQRAEDELIKQALSAPIGTPRLREMARGKNRVVIVVSDITRPVPTYKILPHVLAELKDAGVEDKKIKIIFGLGSHRRHTMEEMKRLVGGDVFARFECIDHNPDDCLWLGKTKGGLPVEIFREVVAADFKICIGNIDLHYFAGYTGGAKAIMPGVSSRASITATHRFMLDPASVAGNMENNPTREAIEEVGEMVGIDFIVNVVLDEEKRILKAVAGDKRLAHREGCVFLDTLFKVEFRDEADIVVVSAGGFPKDINLYQAQKALDNAKYAVKKNGVIILVAECPEGLGEEVFEEWIFAAKNPEEILKRAESEFALGGHKAVAIAMLLQNAQVIMVSSLSRELTERLFFQYAANLDEALQKALALKGPQAKVRVIPFGGSMLPVKSN